MMVFKGLTNLDSLLSRNSISLKGWAEIPQKGFSGAKIFKQENSSGSSFIIKMTTLKIDWIMRATADFGCRESAWAGENFSNRDQIGNPAIGSAKDGELFSILMHDLSSSLLTNERLTHAQFDKILGGIRRMHALSVNDLHDVPWCSIENRLKLFEPNIEKLSGFRISDDILEGWDFFLSQAPLGVSDLVLALFKDTSPLEAALAKLPNCLVHGDLKIDNICLRPDGSVSLIDWSMVMNAPAAIDLGWFLAMNSKALPISLDEAISQYSSISSIDKDLIGHHNSLTVLCGLMIRGWRKALDAKKGEAAEFKWWCEQALHASRIL